MSDDFIFSPDLILWCLCIFGTDAEAQEGGISTPIVLDILVMLFLAYHLPGVGAGAINHSVE